ncbi:MAG: hypothetical protein P0Y59_02610 [Candidatus Sphingomonas phytovorans]|nr:hypothetical protein [Sphingomonas sp.]WEK00603.1 MAG: hypothetical protein P0Y59_02610 [Sphingomonas sp.]
MGKMKGGQVRVRTAEFGNVALGGNAAVLADNALDAVNPTVVTVLAGQPDVPRGLTVKGSDANVTGNVVIEGTNAGGAAISETIALNAANVVAGSKAFRTVTKVTLPKYAVANTERVRIGLAAKLGLPVRLSRNTVIAAYLAGAREATAPTVTVSATVLETNTVTLASALNGTAVIVDFYETN